MAHNSYLLHVNRLFSHKPTPVTVVLILKVSCEEHSLYWPSSTTDIVIRRRDSVHSPQRQAIRMPQLHGYSVTITSHGRDVEHYDVKLEDSDTVSCYIVSESGMVSSPLTCRTIQLNEPQTPPCTAALRADSRSLPYSMLTCRAGGR